MGARDVYSLAPFAMPPAGVAGALPHPVTLSAAKGLTPRLAEALREAGRWWLRRGA